MSEWDPDLTDVDPDRLGGISHAAAGVYHGQINEMLLPEPKSGKMAADVEVLAGSTPGQEGKNQRIFFDDESSAESQKAKLARIGEKLRFAVAAGLTTKDEIAEAKEKKRRFAIDWKMGVGRQIVFRVVANDKTKTGTSVDGFWHLDDPNRPQCPLNQGMLEKQGDSDADPFGGGAGGGSGDPFGGGDLF